MSLDDVRQPRPVKIKLIGEAEDTSKVQAQLMRFLTGVYDDIRVDGDTVTIYFRAVND